MEPYVFVLVVRRLLIVDEDYQLKGGTTHVCTINRRISTKCVLIISPTPAIQHRSHRSLGKAPARPEHRLENRQTALLTSLRMLQ